MLFYGARLGGGEEGKYIIHLAIGSYLEYPTI